MSGILNFVKSSTQYDAEKNRFVSVPSDLRNNNEYSLGNNKTELEKLYEEIRTYDFSNEKRHRRLSEKNNSQDMEVINLDL